MFSGRRKRELDLRVISARFSLRLQFSLVSVVSKSGYWQQLSNVVSSKTIKSKFNSKGNNNGNEKSNATRNDDRRCSSNTPNGAQIQLARTRFGCAPAAAGHAASGSRQARRVAGLLA